MNITLSRLLASILFLLSCAVARNVFAADPPAGKVVWWGRDNFWKEGYSDHTNGIIEDNDEILSNAVAVTAHTWQGLLLKSDGTVLGIGHDFQGDIDAPPDLKDVISVSAAGNSSWGIKRDGRVVRWGTSDSDDQNIVASLTNVVSITWAGYRSYLALQRDGTVLGFRFDSSESTGRFDPATGAQMPANQQLIQLVKARGQILSNVVALAAQGYTPLVLESNGVLRQLGYQTPDMPPSEPRYEAHNNVIYEHLGGESAQMPYRYTTADAVLVDGKPLTNVTAIASGGSHVLALKADGTVMAWGDNHDGATTVPPGLTNVIAIAADANNCLALKRDSTVTAWGNNCCGQTSVPAGLSNVVAIAAAQNFSLAITTGDIPASVYVRPHGRLEEMAREADLVFKGRVLSSNPITNASFSPWGNPHAARIEVISSLKGNADTNLIIFQHNTHGPNGWSGGTPPCHHLLLPGECYLIFAEKTETPGVFRQLSAMQRDEDDGVTRTLDVRPIGGLSVKEAHWVELNTLLTNNVSTNSLYAIQELNALSERCGDDWRHSKDFQRSNVLNRLAPLTTNGNEEVAVAAINCFQITGVVNETKGDSHIGALLKGSITPQCMQELSSYADMLIRIADSGSSTFCRISAIAALAGTKSGAVSNALSAWLKDTNTSIRSQSVLLLSDFPGGFSEQKLRECAQDTSPKIRAAVADAIGNGQIGNLLPILATLFSDPVGRTNPLSPLTMKELQGGGRAVDGDTVLDDSSWPGANIGDVHTSAGYALLKFDLEQVGEILRTNLNDPGFKLQFLCKLAQTNAQPWIKQMVEVMEARRARNVKKAGSNGFPPETYMTLSGTYFGCWRLIYDFLRELPSADFIDGKWDRCLDMLENAGTTGSQEPISLYELYRTKGLDRRAEKLRERCEKTFSYDIRTYFKQVDARLATSPLK